MKLVQEIKKNELLGNSWGIYELNPDEKRNTEIIMHCLRECFLNMQ